MFEKGLTEQNDHKGNQIIVRKRTLLYFTNSGLLYVIIVALCW